MCRRRASRHVADCTISKARRRSPSSPAIARAHMRRYADRAHTCGDVQPWRPRELHPLRAATCTAHRSHKTSRDTHLRRAAPNRHPCEERTRAAPTGLTPRLHTVHMAGVGGAGAPAWGVKGGAGRTAPYPHPAPRPAELGHHHSQDTHTHTHALPTPHHARARANPGLSTQYRARKNGAPVF